MRSTEEQRGRCRRRLVSLLVVGVMAFGSVAVAEPAQAAPARTNNKTNVVYFVHGYTGAGRHDCEEVWGAAKARFRYHAWRGPLRTWGYYARNVRCTANYAGSVNVPIREVGRRLAWDIYNNYTRRGVKADIVAHSMGGLVARAAIRGVQTHTSGFPPSIYVEDVITLSTPHTGTNWARFCTNYQCRDMRPGSAFLSWAGQGPQSTMGTDWTLIGADDDDTITSGSATGMTANVGHRLIYCSGQGIEHNVIMKKTTGSSWCQRVWHHYQRYWVTVRSYSPIGRTYLGAYYWSTY